LRITIFTTVLASLICLSGCSTDQRYGTNHETLVRAATIAVADEAHVQPADIKRTDTEEKGGVLTVLEAPYIEYSRIETKIDSRDENCKYPELEVRIVSNRVLYTRHKEWEQRIQERVLQELRARSHGEESKPTSLPPTPPPDYKNLPAVKSNN
jgi:hypothetical protein